MLDYKRLMLNHYKDELYKVKPLYRLNFLDVYFGIEDPIAYTAFLIFFVYDDNRNYYLSLLRQEEYEDLILDYDETIKLHAMAKPRHRRNLIKHLKYLIAVAQELEVAKKELGEVNQYEFVEAWRLLDIFNNAQQLIENHNLRLKNEQLIKDRNFEVKVDLEVPRFINCVWLYQSINFIRHFQKLRYPLVEGWEEFIRFLLELLGTTAPKTFSFADYVAAVRNNEMERWYKCCKIGFPGYRDAEDWCARYNQQLQRMDRGQLERELQRYNWGNQLVKDQIKTREKIGAKI